MTHPKADGLDALKREVLDAYENDPNIPTVEETLHECGDVLWTLDHLAQRGLIVRDGWVAVPMTATRDMASTGTLVALHSTISGAGGWPEYVSNLYRAMIAAAPKMEGME